MKKDLAIFITLIMVLGLLTGCAAKSEDTAELAGSEKIKIGISMPTYAEERWSVDEEAMKSKCEELGIGCVIACAEGDSNKQKDQVSAMIAQGIQALIIVPNDGNAAAAIVEECKQHNIYVIAYDRMITGTSKIDLHITFDSWYQGNLQGNFIKEGLEKKYGKVKGNIIVLHGDPGDPCAPLYYGGGIEPLQEYIDQGDINVISDNECIGWQPSEATKHTENAMAIVADLGIEIDAVLSPNDGLASGAIAALGDEQAKKTLITGMDCEVAACQRILAGTQSMTVFGDFRDMGCSAVEAAVTLIKEGKVTSNGTMEGIDENGNTIDVPAVLVTCEYIDASNISKVWESGYYTEAEIKGGD